MSNSDEPMVVIQLQKDVDHWQNKYKELEDWIDVKDSTPENNGFYNVLIDVGGPEHIRSSLWFHDGKWKFDDCLSPGCPIYQITYYIDVVKWKPLPEPPKTKTK